jgi:hypothetical protein
MSGLVLFGLGEGIPVYGPASTVVEVGFGEVKVIEVDTDVEVVSVSMDVKVIEK